MESKQIAIILRSFAEELKNGEIEDPTIWLENSFAYYLADTEGFNRREFANLVFGD